MSGKGCECEEGLPEWIMSYADMITILMAFFVVMYSMAGSSPDEAKEQAVMKSLRDRFGPSWPGLAALGPGPYIPINSPLANLTSTGGGSGGSSSGSKQKNKSRGSNETGPRGESRRLQTIRSGEMATIGGVILFADSVSKLSTDNREQLQRIAEEIGGKPQKVEVRGYSSRRPVPPGMPYRDNWDLAYARCHNTMEQLVEMGIDPKRIHLTVAADSDPLPGQSALVRTQHARVEVHLLNDVISTHGGSPEAAEAKH